MPCLRRLDTVPVSRLPAFLLFTALAARTNYSCCTFRGALVALDLDTGEVVWSTQLTSNDAWNGSCSSRGPNCPEEDGPDFDIGASPLLVEDDSGREYILVGQKSGMVYALDPADRGRVIWQQRAGSGGTIESDGPVIVNDRVYITSGYEKWNEAPGNVLLVYSLRGE